MIKKIKKIWNRGSYARLIMICFEIDKHKQAIEKLEEEAEQEANKLRARGKQEIDRILQEGEDG